jgi:hypothetical protein
MDLFDAVIGRSLLLTEALSATSIKQLRAELAVPEILPCTFDVTIPGWLERIRHWGKVKIWHKDPEKHILKRRVNSRQFVDRLSDDSLNRMFGKWTIDKKGLNKVEFHRDYIGASGKHFTELFYIQVELKKELR